MRVLALLLPLLSLLAALPAAATTQPSISIIIDDLGDRLSEGRRAVALPGPVAAAFLPHTPHAKILAEAAHASGKEVMLHLPMQAKLGNALGRGAVVLEMDREDFGDTFATSLASVPHAVGVNNHMGSLLTRHPGHMSWLMQELAARGDLFFVDSRTSRFTVAEQMAREAGIPTIRRHVFLDHDPSIAAVEAQFDLLLRMARRQGVAVGIGHPYPTTLAVLERRLPELEAEGIALIGVRELIELEQERRAKP